MANLPPLPVEVPQKQSGGLFAPGGFLSPVREFVEAPWLGTQGEIPQFVGSALREVSAGYIKPQIEEPETIEERVAAAAGGMFGFGTALGKIGQVTKMRKVGDLVKGKKILQHLQLDHAIPAAIYGFVKDTGLPFGSEEDIAARRSNAVNIGATVGGLSMATKFVQARVATRLMDAALPTLQQNPALRSMVTHFMTDMGIGAGMGLLQPEPGLSRGKSALVGALGFGAGGLIGGLGRYKEVKMQANDLRDNLIASGTSAIEANKVINKFYDGKMSFDELRTYNQALKDAKDTDTKAKIASGIVIKSAATYGETVGKKETPATAEARAKAAAEVAAKKETDKGSNQQQQGKADVVKEQTQQKVQELYANERKKIEQMLNVQFKDKDFSKKNPVFVEDIFQQHIMDLDKVSPDQRAAVSDASIQDKVMKRMTALKEVEDIILKSHMDDAVNTVYPDVNWETDNYDVVPMNDALNSGKKEAVKIIVDGKKKSKQEKTAAAKKAEAEQKKIVKAQTQQVIEELKKQQGLTKKKAKTDKAIAAVDEQHIRDLEKAIYGGEEEPAMPEQPGRPSLEEGLKTLREAKKVKRTVVAGKDLYIMPQQKGFNVRRLGGEIGQPSTTDVDRAVRYAGGTAGTGEVIVLRGEKISAGLKAFPGAESVYRGKINVRDEMNMLDSSAQPDFYVRSEFGGEAPLSGIKDVILIKGKVSPDRLQKWVNVVTDHNRRYPDDPITLTLVSDKQTVKVRYVEDQLDIRDIYKRNVLDSIEDRIGSEYSHRGEDTIKLTDEIVMGVNRILQTPGLYNREAEKVTQLRWQGLPELGGQLVPVKPVKTIGDAIERAMEEIGYREKGKTLSQQKDIILTHLRKFYDRNDIELDMTPGKIKASFKKIFTEGGKSTDSVTLDTSKGIPMDIPDVAKLELILKELTANCRTLAENGEYSLDKHTTMNDKLYQEVARLKEKLEGIKSDPMEFDHVEFLTGVRDDATSTLKWIKQNIESTRRWLGPTVGPRGGVREAGKEPGKIAVMKGGKEVGAYYKRRPPYPTAEYEMRATAGLEPSERKRSGELKALYARKQDVENNIDVINKVLAHIERYRELQKMRDSGVDVDAEANAYFKDKQSLLNQRADSRPFQDEEAAKAEAYGPTYYGGATPEQLKGRLFQTQKDVTITDVDGRSAVIKAGEKITIDKIKKTTEDGVEQTEYHVNHGINKWVTREQLADVIDISGQVKHLGSAKEYFLNEPWQEASLFPGIVDKFNEDLKLTAEERIQEIGTNASDQVNYAFKKGRNATTAGIQEAVRKGKEVSRIFEELTKGKGVLDRMDIADDILKAMHEVVPMNPNDLMSATRTEYGTEELLKGTSAWERLTSEEQKFTLQLAATYKAMAQVLVRRGLLSMAAMDAQLKEGFGPIVHLDPQGNIMNVKGNLFGRGTKQGVRKSKWSYEESLAIAKAHNSRLLSDPGKLLELRMMQYSKSLGNDHTARTLEAFRDFRDKPALAFAKDIAKEDYDNYIPIDSNNPDVRGLRGLYSRWIGKSYEEPYILKDLVNGNVVDKSATGRWLQSLTTARGSELLLHPAVSGYAKVKGMLKSIVLTNPTYLLWQSYNSFIPILGPFGAAKGMFKYAGFKDYRNVEELRQAAERAGVRTANIEGMLSAVYDDFTVPGKGDKNKLFWDVVGKKVYSKFGMTDWLFKRMELGAIQAWEMQRARFERSGIDAKRSGELAAEAINLAMGMPDKTAFDGFTNFTTNMFFLARNNQIAMMRMTLGSGMAVDPRLRASSQMFGFHGYTPKERQALGNFFALQIGWQLASWSISSAMLSYFMSGGLPPWKRSEDINKALMIHTGIRRPDGNEVLVDAPIFKDARDLLQLVSNPRDYLKNKSDPTLKAMLEIYTGGQIIPGEKGFIPFSKPGATIPEHITDMALKKFFSFASIAKPVVSALGGEKIVNRYGELYPKSMAQQLSDLAGFRQGVGRGGVGVQGAAVRAAMDVQKRQQYEDDILRNAMMSAHMSGNPMEFYQALYKLYPDATKRARALKNFREKVGDPAQYQLGRMKNNEEAMGAYRSAMMQQEMLGGL